MAHKRPAAPAGEKPKISRMCMVCRERREKRDLIRIVKTAESPPAIDPTHKAQGRGMYLCSSAECTGQAQKRRVVERAFSCAVDPGLYEEIRGLGEMSGE